jgi:hypothetical protein
MVSLHLLDHSIPGLLVARQLLAPLRRLDVLQLPIHLSLDFELILLRQISKRDFDHVLLINVRVISHSLLFGGISTMAFLLDEQQGY